MRILRNIPTCDPADNGKWYLLTTSFLSPATHNIKDTLQGETRTYTKSGGQGRQKETLLLFHSFDNTVVFIPSGIQSILFLYVKYTPTAPTVESRNNPRLSTEQSITKL